MQTLVQIKGCLSSIHSSHMWNSHETHHSDYAIAKFGKIICWCFTTPGFCVLLTCARLFLISPAKSALHIVSEQGSLYVLRPFLLGVWETKADNFRKRTNPFFKTSSLNVPRFLFRSLGAKEVHPSGLCFMADWKVMTLEKGKVSSWWYFDSAGQHLFLE